MIIDVKPKVEDSETKTNYQYINDAQTSSPFVVTSTNNLNSAQNSTYPGWNMPTAPRDSNPPPYPYPQPQTGGFQSNNSPTTAIMATQALNEAIKQNGRTALTVVCPNCHNTVVTKITQVENPTVSQEQTQRACIFIVVVIFMMIVFFIGLRFMTGNFKWSFIAIPVFLVFILIVCVLMWFSHQNTEKMCKDIQHHCSSCNALLGVNNGTEIYHKIQMQNAMMYRSHHGRF